MRVDDLPRPLRRWAPTLRRFRPRPLARRLARPRVLFLAGLGAGPLSRRHGLERGTPIDRFYIDRFVDAHRTDLRGRCLEIGGASYLRRFGGPAITSRDVLDIDPGNDGATLIADLRRMPQVPDDSFDCIVLLQVLQFVDDVTAAVGECARVLAPGGTLLLTVPATAPLDALAPPGVECWRFTPTAVAHLLRPHFPEPATTIESCGNVRAGLAIWAGMAQEEVALRRLRHTDPQYPCLVTARAVKPPRTGRPS